MLARGDEIGGRYRLLHRVGEGGMAVVWCAEHMSLQRLVAIKFIAHTGRRAEEQARRFLREARTMAVVRHRNVSEILDYGVTPDGTSYMVMEYLEGEDLSEAFQRVPSLALGTFLDIMQACLSGLAAVHDVGVIHRDIKPSNIFLVRDADGFFPKILDFGLSRKSPTEAFKESLEPLTDDGVIVGTLQYMAPEQVQGRDAHVRGDLYAMGLIIYEGVTGLRPFSSTNLVDVVAAISAGRLPPLPEAREGPFEELGGVVHKAISRRPEERFADARAFRRLLKKAADGLPAELLEEPLPTLSEPDRNPHSLGIGTHIASLNSDITNGPSGAEATAKATIWPWAVILAAAVALAAMGSVVFQNQSRGEVRTDDPSSQSPLAVQEAAQSAGTDQEESHEEPAAAGPSALLVAPSTADAGVPNQGGASAAEGPAPDAAPSRAGRGNRQPGASTRAGAVGSRVTRVGGTKGRSKTRGTQRGKNQRGQGHAAPTASSHSPSKGEVVGPDGSPTVTGGGDPVPTNGAAPAATDPGTPGGLIRELGF